MNGNRGTNPTSRQLARARWLLRLVAKWMVRQPDGTAHVVLPAAWVDNLHQFIAEPPATP